MVAFSFLDWFWLVVYIVIMVFCGVLFYRLGKRSMSDFFLAGRGLPWWLPASSVYATHTATDTPIWVSGVIYKYGLRGIWYTFFSAWCAISAFASTRIFRRSLAYTRLNGKPSASLASAQSSCGDGLAAGRYSIICLSLAGLESPWASSVIIFSAGRIG